MCSVWEVSGYEHKWINKIWRLNLISNQENWFCVREITQILISVASMTHLAVENSLTQTTDNSQSGRQLTTQTSSKYSYTLSKTRNHKNHENCLFHSISVLAFVVYESIIKIYQAKNVEINHINITHADIHSNSKARKAFKWIYWIDWIEKWWKFRGNLWECLEWVWSNIIESDSIEEKKMKFHSNSTFRLQPSPSQCK